MNIFDIYSPYQLREIFLQKNWPEDFKNWIHQEIAMELLDKWLVTIDNISYKEKVRDIIEDMTYGYQDKDGNEMLDFRPDGTV